MRDWAKPVSRQTGMAPKDRTVYTVGPSAKREGGCAPTTCLPITLATRPATSPAFRHMDTSIETAWRQLTAAIAVVGAVAAVGAFAFAARPASAEIRFEGPIRWTQWDSGLKTAAARKKPVLLLLFTDSCPKCTLLGELFKTNKDVHKLASEMVMIHVNSGTAPMAVVNRFARFGNYVPRIVFLRPDGSTVDEITSSNAGFPYYYQPSRPEFLIAAMLKAKGFGGSANGGKRTGKVGASGKTATGTASKPAGPAARLDGGSG
ncbi:MAG: hypothetical protein EXR77_08585 [Myxococcales bacterium]|nr:hypothetical protein [Myxococcales bacterium]